MPGRPPRWFWLLPLLAVAAWWPLSPAWQSDDYLAVPYARDLGRVLHDFAGPQYGASDVWLFYRPLITLSFWLDGLVGGADPFVSHLSNVLAHGISALLAALLWRRFADDRAAFCAGLLWALMPSHNGAIAWAVGRVDSHTTVWCLATLVLFLRRGERADAGLRAPAWPMLLTAAAALASKELAFVLPPLAMVLAFARGDGGFAQRLHLAVRRSAPLWTLLGAYLLLRWYALGRFGGYLGAAYEPTAMARGLATYLADLTVPLRWCGGDLVAGLGLPPAWPLWLACAPLVPALVHWARRPGRLAVAAALFLVASAPLAAFLAGAGYALNLRYFYLPAIVLAGLFALPGRLATALTLLCWLPALLSVRQQQLAADRQSGAMHAAMLREANDDAPAPMFVQGLPHGNASGTAVQLHFGVDRMLQPPFATPGTRLYALRPFDELPTVFRLDAPDDVPFALPSGSTWFFADATVFARAPATTPDLPDLPLAGDVDGVVDFTTPRLRGFAARFAELFARREPSFLLLTPGVQPQAYRVTILTASGYLCCLCYDHGFGPAGTGSIDGLRFLVHDQGHSLAALYALSDSALASAALIVPTTLDLVPEFPVLIEAGTFDPSVLKFVPTHRARRLLTFRFDRDYAAFVRALQGKG